MHMINIEKKMSKWLVFVAVLLLAACGGEKSELSKEGNYLGDQEMLIEDFTFVNESGEKFGLANLKDEIWLADFIFTHCTSVCPPMSANMSKVQQKLEDEGLKVPIVSFTVDPDRDTPEVLKEYAEQYGANLETWHFLTGYSFDEIKKLSEGTFKSPVAKPVEGDDQFMHGVNFYLIDGNRIVKSYNGVSNVPIEAIVEDVKVLQEKKG